MRVRLRIVLNQVALLSFSFVVIKAKTNKRAAAVYQVSGKVVCMYVGR